MLEDSLFESQGQEKTRRPATVVVSAMVHVVALVVLVLIPLLQTQALTIPPPDMSLLLPRTEKPRNVAVFSAQPPVQSRPTQADLSSPTLTTPPSIPPRIVFVDDPVRPEVGFLGLPGGNGFGLPVVGSVDRPIEVAPPAIVTPPPPPVIDAHPVRVSIGVQTANLIYQVKPVYPEIAKRTRIQGIVVLEAVISKGGSVDALRVISGHPLLTQAALDAVKQWRYRPTMLNGEPIDVVTTVTVTFTLQ